MIDEEQSQIDDFYIDCFIEEELMRKHEVEIGSDTRKGDEKSPFQFIFRYKGGVYKMNSLTIKIVGHEYVKAFENEKTKDTQPDFKGDGVAVWIYEKEEKGE